MFEKWFNRKSAKNIDYNYLMEKKCGKMHAVKLKAVYFEK